MSDKRKLLLIFGGRSSEHAISVRSATEVAIAVDRGKWDLQLVAIAPDGRLLTGDRDFGPGEVLRSGHGITDLRALQPDVVFPLLHGPYGEDGAIQGFLETVGLPYVGSGVLASSMCMDKLVLKRWLSAHDLPVVGGLELRRADLIDDRETWLNRAAQLDLPLFVKPATGGSSIGITKVTAQAELPAAVDLALRYDDKILVERGLDGPREIEFAVLEDAAGRVQISPPGEIVLPPGVWYDFDTKYANQLASLEIPARLPAARVAELQRLAEQAFRVAGCAGLARIDFFLEGPESRPFINEINTMPGFTTISMYPKLVEQLGIAYADLIDRLCEVAIARGRRRLDVGT